MSLDKQIKHWRRRVSVDPTDDHAIIQLGQLLQRIEKSEDKYEIQRVLVLSTGHIREQDERFLRNHDGAYYIIPYEYGYFVWVPSELENLEDAMGEVPPKIGELIKLAFEENCQWLRLDSDGMIVEGLEEFDW